jgi:hypothetical protein
MRDVERVTISLTGPDSHTIVLEPGMGSLTLGPAPACDVTVDVDDRIDWSVFDPMTVPAGYPWPRWFSYTGNDTGFLAWSAGRRTESFHWEPTAPATVDAAEARIDRLMLTLRTVPLAIVLPILCSEVAVFGDADLFRPELAPGASCPPLRFVPDTTASPTVPPIALPDLAAVGDATKIDVWTTPLRQAFDCSSLLQFPRVETLSLAGQLTGLAALASLRELSQLQLRHCPDLTDLPPLTSWPDLSGLMVSNVEAGAGRRLRTELKQREKASGHRWEHSWVRELRAPEWFATEYGLPFTEWPRATARKAKKAFEAAVVAATSAQSPDDVEAAVRKFTATLNDLPGLYTIEREDAAEAVTQIAAKTDVSAEQALAWFDAERDF